MYWLVNMILSVLYCLHTLHVASTFSLGISHVHTAWVACFFPYIFMLWWIIYVLYNIFVAMMFCILTIRSHLKTDVGVHV